jgi:hypothetical protein
MSEDGRNQAGETFADTQLDEPFFLELGRFITNCGHLEQVLWHLYIKLAQVDVEDDVQTVTAIKAARKSLGQLIDDIIAEINAAISPQVIQHGELISFFGEMKNDVIWRNLAAHSAWKKVEGGYKSAMFFKKEDNSDHKDIDSYKAFSAVVSLDDIMEASESASSYLTRTLTAIALIETLQAAKKDAGCA